MYLLKLLKLLERKKEKSLETYCSLQLNIFLPLITAVVFVNCVTPGLHQQ